MKRLNFYLVDSMIVNGRRPEGEWNGFFGWRKGFYGPTTWKEAQRVSALIGGRIVDFGEIGEEIIEMRINELLGEEKELKRIHTQDIVRELNGQNDADLERLLKEHNKPEPKYQDMLKEMAAAGYDWESATGGSRKATDVKIVYLKYLQSLEPAE